MITWTQTKTSGESVDIWTKIDLAAILELDGSCGKITKIVNYNNHLIAFQERGICYLIL